MIFIVFEVFKIFKIFIGFYRFFIGSYTIHPDRPYLAPLLALVFFVGFTVYDGGCGV